MTGWNEHPNGPIHFDSDARDGEAVSVPVQVSW